MSKDAGKESEPRLTRLILANFKAFGRRQHIPIRPITLIYGRNNSGKSSILHSLLYARSLLGGPTPEVLIGGWQRLIHGRNQNNTMEIGWEWSNPGSESGLHAGKIINRFGKEDGKWSKQTLFAELNGQSLFNFTEQDDMFWEPQPHIDQKECTAALNNLQKWMAAELDLFVKSSGKDSVTGRIVAATSSKLKSGEFSDQIISSLISDQRGLKLGWDGGTLPPKFSYETNLEAEFLEHRYTFPAWYGKRFAGLHHAWYPEEETDPIFSGGLSTSYEAHVESFVIERCAYLYFRWLECMWENFTIPISNLLDSLHHIPAVRNRPEDVLLRERISPERLQEKSKRIRNFDSLADWVFQPAAIVEAENWLKKNKQLAGNLKIVFQEFDIAKKKRNPSENLRAATLSLFDEIRKIPLRFDEVGFGLSQFIPILLACFAKQESVRAATGTLLIEEPEAHVHPALQSELGDVFIKATTREDQPLRNIICETHSEHLLLRIKRRIREKQISPEHVAVLYVENMGKESIVQEMQLNENGDLLRDWPGGFFEEGLREVLL